jgi:glycosyltransferase involved in cell wall biosynthesis
MGVAASPTNIDTAMSKQPLVSIVIIFLDAEHFIREAVESVFAQTYTNWELLLVDDGSTDGSTEIARRYAEIYSEQFCYMLLSEHELSGLSVFVIV